MSRSSVGWVIFSGVLFFFLLNVNFISPWLGMYFFDARRLIAVFILITLLLWTLCDVALARGIMLRVLQFPIGARLGVCSFFALGLLSAALAKFPVYALMQVGWYSCGFLSILAISVLIRARPRADHLALSILMLTLGVYELQVLKENWYFQYQHNLAHALNDPEFFVFASPAFQQIRFLAQFISWTLPLSVLPLCVYRQHPRVCKMLYVLVPSLWWYTLILNHSRALYVEWVIILPGVFLVFRAQAKRWAIYQALCAALGAMFYLVFLKIIPMCWGLFPVTPAQMPFGNVRLRIWSYALENIWAHPWLGLGPLQYAAFYQPKPYPAHPHNSVLNLMVEYGIPATLILLAVVLAGVCCWVKQLRQVGDVRLPQLKVALWAAMLGAGTHSLLSGIIVMPLSQITGFFVVGWWLSLYEPGSTVAISSLRKYLVFLFWVALSLCLLINGVFPHVFHLNASTAEMVSKTACLHQSEGCQFSPNFWVQGWIEFWV